MARRSFQIWCTCVTGKDGAIAQQVVFTGTSDAYRYSSDLTVLVLPFLGRCDGLDRVQVFHRKFAFEAEEFEADTSVREIVLGVAKDEILIRKRPRIIYTR